MLDIQLLRNNIDAVAQRLATRGYTLETATFQKLENERKTLQTRTQDLQASRNSLSKQIGMLKGKGEDASAVMAEVAALKSELEANEVRLGELLKEFDAFVAKDASRPVPLHLRNAPTRLMKELDYGKEYRYAHDEEGAYAAGENYFPEGMQPPGWYQPVPRGLEIKIGEKLAHLRDLDRDALKAAKSAKNAREPKNQEPFKD